MKPLIRSLALTVLLLFNFSGLGSPAYAYNYAWSSYEDRTDPDFPYGCNGDPCCNNPNGPGCECDPDANPCSSCFGSGGGGGGAPGGTGGPGGGGAGGLGSDHGSPVYLKLGLLDWSETDLVLPGTPAVRLQRNYHSKNPYIGLFGNSTISGFEKIFTHVVRYERDGNNSRISREYYLLRFPNGKRYYFSFDPQQKSFEDLGKTGFVPEYVDEKRVKLSYPNGTVETYYDGYLTEVVDAKGRSLRLEYDDNMLLQRVVSDSAQSLEFYYDTTGKVSQVSDGHGRAWNYSYDGNGNLVEVVDPSGGVRSYSYKRYKASNDAQVYWLLTSVTDAEQRSVIEVTYDSRGRVASYTEGERRWSYTYTSPTRISKKDNAGRTITYELNGNGIIVAVTDPMGNRISRRTDGNTTTDTNALGQTVSRVYDGMRRLVAVTDPLGNTTRYEYEGTNSRPSKIVSPLGHTTVITYDARQNPLSVTDANGNTQYFKYDGNGNVVEVTDAMGNKTTITYNADNRPVTITDASGNTATITYDDLGREQSVTDAEGRTTSYEYDPMGRIVKTTDAIGNTVEYSYDKTGRLVSVKDPVGNETVYTYDEYGRLASETRPDGGVTTYTYNSDNTVKSVKRRDGKTVTYTYDALGRPTAQSVDGDTVRYTYDAEGNILSATNGSGTVSFSYDAAGKIVKETQNGIDVLTVYDKDSNVKTLSFLGRSITYTRDAAGLASRIGDIAFTYDKNGIPTGVSYPNGTGEAYTFDAVYNLKSIQTADQTINYSHDKTGLITAKNTTDYGYDKIGRLIKAGADTFTYDKAGNNLNGNAVYNPLNNRFDQSDFYAVTYDAMGNIKSKYNKLTKEKTLYTFNARNQLTQYVLQDENNQTVKTLEFAYDAFGRRISKTEDGVTQKYLYDGDDIIAILDNDNNVIATITHDESIDTPLSITNANGTFYYHRDHQGSIIALTDENGQVVESFTYDNHYGAIINHTETVETNNPYAYTGREADAPDLYYYRARYYDPTLERFISEDPIGFASGDFNWYRYVGNSPITYIDPYGYNALAGAIAGGEAGAIFGPVGAIIGAGAGAALFSWGAYELWEWWNSPEDNICYSEPFDPTKWPKRKKGKQKQPGYENPKDGSIWEKDNAGHGGRKWKRWKNRKDWEKGKRREGSYDENGNRIAD